MRTYSTTSFPELTAKAFRYSRTISLGYLETWD